MMWWEKAREADRGVQSARGRWGILYSRGRGHYFVAQKRRASRGAMAVVLT